MRAPFVLVIITVIGAIPVAVAAADSASPVDVRQASLSVGAGPTVPGLGLSGEKYFGAGRASVFAGVGYVPHSHNGRGAAGAAGAGGFRVFSAGRVHRALLEASFSPVAVEVTPEGSTSSGQTFSYGPGLSAGYSMVKHSGFTLLLSVGVGRGVTGPEWVHSTQLLSTVAIGHTWVRR